MQNDVGDLGRLKPAPGSIKKTKRLGRGRGSGHGDTATKGNKGAQSRSGYKVRAWFEGGQMPLNRRLPKRGFNILNRTNYLEVNLCDMGRIEGEVADPDSFRKARLVKGRGPIVLLGNGDVDRAITVKVHRITKSAEEKIKAAGGSVELLPLEPIDRRVKKGPKPKHIRKQEKKQQEL